MSSDLATKSIRFPAASYIGFDPRPSDKDVLPLGFMTEDGTDKAAEKRKATVDNWADKKVPPRALPNEPMVGFRLSRSIRRDSGWGSGNVKWRIEDPRGFELEISSPNLAQIISSCVIENGEILDECMWARLGGDNVLVPTSSDLYQTTKTNSERMKMSVKPSTVQIGNRIVLQNGVEGVYCGKMFQVGRDYRSDSDYAFGLTVDSKPKHVLVDDDVIYSYASLKVAAILDDKIITVQDAEALVWPKQPFLVHRMDIPKVERQPLAASEVASYGGQMVAHVPEFDNEWCKFSKPSAYNRELTLTAIHKEDLDEGRVRIKQWYANREDGERMKAAGLRMGWGGYSHQRSNKSAYANIDPTSLACEGLFRTWVTEAGNTFIERIVY